MKEIAYSILNNRAFMYHTKKAHINGEKLRAIKYIKDHIEFAKNKDKMIKLLLPKFEIIMPGKESKFYPAMREKLNKLYELSNSIE
jgi:hypothetical protein